MSARTWIKAVLDAHGIAYRERHHAPAATATELAECEHFSGHRVVKVVLVMADGRPVELVLPASRNVDLNRVEGLLGARDVRLASELELAACFPDCEVGASPPFPRGRVREVWLDDAMYVSGPILFSAGTHKDAVIVDFQDWLRLVKPNLGGFSTTRGLQELSLHPAEIAADVDDDAPLDFFDELLDVLRLQAKEIERLSVHVEQQTEPLLEPSRMPNVVSRLIAMRSRLRFKAAAHEAHA